MRKSVSLLLVAAVCVVMFGLPSAANADELKVAKRWALGLSASPFSGYAPTVEYWTSDNFGLSASFSGYYHWATIGLRGTYYGEQKVLDSWSRCRVLDMPFHKVVANHLWLPLGTAQV